MLRMLSLANNLLAVLVERFRMGVTGRLAALLRSNLSKAGACAPSVQAQLDYRSPFDSACSPGAHLVELALTLLTFVARGPAAELT